MHTFLFLHQRSHTCTVASNLEHCIPILTDVGSSALVIPGWNRLGLIEKGMASPLDNTQCKPAVLSANFGLI